MSTQPPLTTASTPHTPHAGPDPAADPDLSPFAYRRGNGKIARLPKKLRDEISQSLAAGCAYRYIIEFLRQYGHYLTPNNLSQWKKHGYQHWLFEQQWLAKTRLREDTAADLSADFNAHDLSHATLQLALLQMFDAMRALGEPDAPQPQPDPGLAPKPSPAPESPPNRALRSKLDACLGGNAKTFFSLVHTLARASRELATVQERRNLSTPAPPKPLPPLGFDFIRPKSARKATPVPAVPTPAANQVTQPLAKPVPKPPPPSTAVSQPPANAQPNGKPQISSAVPSATSGSPSEPPPSTQGRPIPVLPPPQDGTAPQPNQAKTEPSETTAPTPAAAPQPASAGTEEPNPSGCPPEFCLQCGTRLPNRLANTSRPFPNCRNCATPLPVCLCNLSSLEKCPRCRIPLPRPHPSGRRPEPMCYNCGLPLDDPPKHVLATVREYWRQREAELARVSPG